nr:aldehyde dehydrogenase family protein [Acetobacter ascendens]
MTGLINNAEAQGAQVIHLGRDSQEHHVMAPVLLLNVTPQMTVMQEEIFGPILPVLTYRKLDEAIAFINARPRPLALYYFGSDRNACKKVLKYTISGNVTINGTLLHVAQDDWPFGGVGDSGIGAYHGKEGFIALRALLEIRYDRFSRGFERDSKAGCGRQHNEAAWPELHARRNAIRLI